MLGRISLSLLAVLLVAPAHAVESTAAAVNDSPPAVVQALPANTPGVLFINTTSETWAALDRFNASPIPLSALGVPFLPSWLNFATDIQPWLGDRIAFAVMPVPTGQRPLSLDNHTVLLAPVKDDSRIQPLLDKIKANRGQPQSERDYKGAKVLVWEPPATPAPTPSPDSSINTMRPGSAIQPSFAAQPSNISSYSLDPLKDPVNALPEAITRFTWRWQLAQLQSSLAREPVTQATPVAPVPLPSPAQPLPTPSPDASPDAPAPTETVPPTPPKGLAIAVFPGYLATASAAQPLEQLIDAQTGLTPLAQNPLFQRTLQHPRFGQALIAGYGDIAGLAQFALASANLPVPPLPVPPLPVPLPTPRPSDFEQLTKRYNTVELLTWVQPEGIHSQGSIYYTTPSPDYATATSPDDNQILARLPAATYLSANSRNFKQQWQVFARDVDADPASRFITKGIRDFFRNSFGLDLEQDLIPWLDGQYALFFYPTDQGFFPFFEPKLKLGVGLMLQTSDRAAAETALEKLTQHTTKQPGSLLKIANRTVQGQPVVSWEGLDRGRSVSFFSYGWVNNDTLILTTGAGAMSALTPKPYIPLTETLTFQTATASLPRPNEGYFYVNMGSSLSFLYGLLIPPTARGDSPEIRQFKQAIGSIRSISTANSATAEKQQFDSLLVLAPARKP